MNPFVAADAAEGDDGMLKVKQVGKPHVGIGRVVEIRDESGALVRAVRVCDRLSVLGVPPDGGTVTAKGFVLGEATVIEMYREIDGALTIHPVPDGRQRIIPEWAARAIFGIPPEAGETRRYAIVELPEPVAEIGERDESAVAEAERIAESPPVVERDDFAKWGCEHVVVGERFLCHVQGADMYFGERDHNGEPYTVGVFKFNRGGRRALTEDIRGYPREWRDRHEAARTSREMGLVTGTGEKDTAGMTYHIKYLGIVELPYAVMHGTFTIATVHDRTDAEKFLAALTGDDEPQEAEPPSPVAETAGPRWEKPTPVDGLVFGDFIHYDDGVDRDFYVGTYAGVPKIISVGEQKFWATMPLPGFNDRDEGEDCCKTWADNLDEGDEEIDIPRAYRTAYDTALAANQLPEHPRWERPEGATDWLGWSGHMDNPIAYDCWWRDGSVKLVWDTECGPWVLLEDCKQEPYETPAARARELNLPQLAARKKLDTEIAELRARTAEKERERDALGAGA